MGHDDSSVGYGDCHGDNSKLMMMIYIL